MERAGVKRFAWLLWWRGMGIALKNKDVVNVEGLLCNATFSGDALRSNVVVRHKIGIAEYLHNLPKNVQWWISFLVPAVWHVLCTRGSDSTACGIDSQTHAGLASHAQNIHRTWQRHIIWQKKRENNANNTGWLGKHLIATYIYVSVSDFNCTVAAKEAVRRRKFRVGKRLGKVVGLKQAWDFQPGGWHWCPKWNQTPTVLH